MDVFLKVIAAILATVILTLVLAKNGKDFALLTVICVSCMVCIVGLTYLEKVISFFRQLKVFSNLDPELISVVLKTTGIGLLSEITVMICNDSGNTALGKVIQMLTVSVILWLCIPLFSELLNLVESILGNI